MRTVVWFEPFNWKKKKSPRKSHKTTKIMLRHGQTHWDIEPIIGGKTCCNCQRANRDIFSDNQLLLQVNLIPLPFPPPPLPKYVISLLLNSHTHNIPSPTSWRLVRRAIFVREYNVSIEGIFSSDGNVLGVSVWVCLCDCARAMIWLYRAIIVFPSIEKKSSAPNVGWASLSGWIQFVRQV